MSHCTVAFQLTLRRMVMVHSINIICANDANGAISDPETGAFDHDDGVYDTFNII